MVCSLVLALLPLSTAEAKPLAECREDITGFLGILTFWRPIDNCLVYGDQIVQFDGDRIEKIDSWSRTHLVVTTAFGDRNIIDLGRVPRPKGPFWQAPKIDHVRGIMQPYTGGGDLEHLVSQRTWTAIRSQGIGPIGSAGFFFKVKETASGVTAVQELPRNYTVKAPIVFRLPSGSIPVSIRSQTEYAFIGPGNSRFGPLLVRSGSKRWTLFKDAQMFIPLYVK